MGFSVGTGALKVGEYGSLGWPLVTEPVTQIGRLGHVTGFSAYSLNSRIRCGAHLTEPVVLLDRDKTRCYQYRPMMRGARVALVLVAILSITYVFDHPGSDSRC